MKKKICFVVSSVHTARSFLSDHIAKLTEEFDIYLVGNFTANEEHLLKELKLANFKSIQIHRNINLLKDIRSVIVLTKYLKQQKFHATHSVTPKAGLIAALASFLARTPNRIHIFTGQVWHTKNGIIKQVLILLDKIIARLDTHILVDGESQRQFLIDNRVLKVSNSFVLGRGSISGVNIERFQTCQEIRDHWRKELELVDKVVFGFLGRLNKDKGITELYTAFNQLAENKSNVHLIFIGGDEENMLALLPRYSHIREGKSFTNFGFTNKPEEVLQAIDVFCLPSHREGFGTSVLEASCLGIPVICSDTYGLMDAMVDGKTGLRHKVGQSEDLFEKMKILGENKALCERIGLNARKFVTDNFSGEMITNEWVKFYNSLG